MKLTQIVGKITKLNKIVWTLADIVHQNLLKEVKETSTYEKLEDCLTTDTLKPITPEMSLWLMSTVYPSIIFVLSLLKPGS